MRAHMCWCIASPASAAAFDHSKPRETQRVLS